MRDNICALCHNFGIQYHNKEDLDLLMNALQTKYEISTDVTGSNYIGLVTEQNYKEKQVDISMPDYILKIEIPAYIGT